MGGRWSTHFEERRFRFAPKHAAVRLPARGRAEAARWKSCRHDARDHSLRSIKPCLRWERSFILSENTPSAGGFYHSMQHSRNRAGGESRSRGPSVSLVYDIIGIMRSGNDGICGASYPACTHETFGEEAVIPHAMALSEMPATLSREIKAAALALQLRDCFRSRTIAIAE